MVDEYVASFSRCVLLWCVQIPLWSMNTYASAYATAALPVQIPLWSMNTLPNLPASYLGTCSDSSMVDEYIKPLRQQLHLYMFRFLYGRWIRNSTVVASVNLIKFRFLYGRWIPVFGSVVCFFAFSFRFLYGRWILFQSRLFLKLSPFRFLYGRWILPVWILPL